MSTASKFWAVLIGINEYASYPLRGCVPDAQLVEKYLVENLGVPRNRIQLLLGSKEYTSPEDPMYPSRAHVVGALLSLITNPEITPGDNIIIYYSDTDHTTHLIRRKMVIPIIPKHCAPYDRDTPGEDGKPVPDISDRELNTILSLISRTKGHRITVILDCCHSGGVCRNLPEPGARTSPPMARASHRDMPRCRGE